MSGAEMSERIESLVVGDGLVSLFGIEVEEASESWPAFPPWSETSSSRSMGWLTEPSSSPSWTWLSPST